MNIYGIEILIVIITKIEHKGTGNIIKKLCGLSVIIKCLLLTIKGVKFFFIDIKLPTIPHPELIKAHQPKQTANNQAILGQLKIIITHNVGINNLHPKRIRTLRFGSFLKED
jgi:hypothetical protein